MNPPNTPRGAPTLQRQMNAMPPMYYSNLPPQQKLAIVEEALFVLGSGQAKAQVRHGDYWVTYHPGSMTYLERERARLQAQTTARSAITVGRGWL